jgi:predicted transcriptional regulator
MSKALSKDIDVVTVLSMRDDDGMTQKEIANRLGCHPSTISRILKGYPRQIKVTIPRGPDPEMDDFFAKPIPPEPSVPAPPQRRKKTLVTTRFTVAGTYLQYIVNLRRGCVEVCDQGEELLFELPLSELPMLIAELTELEETLRAQASRRAAGPAADD